MSNGRAGAVVGNGGIQHLAYPIRIGETVRKELEDWKKHPELSKIVRRMESISRADKFLDTFAEYAIARRFFRSGRKIEVEVPTANGKSADLRVSNESSSLYAHIKRLNLDEIRSRQGRLAPMFARLKKIKRPIQVEICLHPDLTPSQWKAAVNAAEPFIQEAVKGDRMVLLHEGVELGTALVLGDSGSDHTAIYVSHGVQECTNRRRMPNKLSDANTQFMPGATNIIFLGLDSTTRDDLVEFENTLLGSPWSVIDLDDNMKPVTVKEGRKPDGFWSGVRHPDSQAACCFCPMLATGEVDFKVCIRAGSEGKIPSWFDEIFRN